MFGFGDTLVLLLKTRHCRQQPYMNNNNTAGILTAQPFVYRSMRQQQRTSLKKILFLFSQIASEGAFLFVCKTFNGIRRRSLSCTSSKSRFARKRAYTKFNFLSLPKLAL
jgi:superfamily I DNA and RNA helicase